MYVITLKNSDDPRSDMFYVSRSSMTLSGPEVWRRFGERGARPRLFRTVEEANGCLGEWTGSVVCHAPRWAYPDPLEAALDVYVKLLDILAR
jgi:hypothetical protein